MSVPSHGSKVPTPVSRVDWVTGDTTYDVSQMDASQLWRSAVACAATKARQALPACATRIDKSLALVLNNAVELLPDGTAIAHNAWQEK